MENYADGIKMVRLGRFPAMPVLHRMQTAGPEHRANEGYQRLGEEHEHLPSVRVALCEL